MVQSARLKKLARDHMSAHPGVAYQQALEIVTAGGRAPLPPHAAANAVPAFLDALGIADINTHDFAAAWEASEALDSLVIPVGYLRHGDELTPQLSYLNFDGEDRGGNGPHGAISGRTGMGKSNLLRSLALGLAAVYSPQRVTMLLADAKGGSTFRDMEKLPHVQASISNLENNPEQLDWLAAVINGELDRRNEFIATRKHRSDIFEYRRQQQMHPSDPEWPALPDMVVIVDEFGTSRIRHRDLLAALVRTTRIGRVLGVHLVVCDQYINQQVLDGIVEHLSFRYTLAVSPQDSLAMIGNDAAAELSGGKLKGKMLRKFSGDTTPVEVAAFHVEAPLDAGEGRHTPMSDALIARLTALPRAPRTLRDARVDAVRTEIDTLVGQEAVRTQLHAVLARAQVVMEQRRRGLAGNVDPQHYVFTGAPGSGKHRTAGILARTLHTAGILTAPYVTSMGRTDLVGAVEGSSAAAVAQCLSEARGGILFIENANELLQSGTPDAFGRAAVDALAAAMSGDRQDTAVVLAGRPEKMHTFLQDAPELAALCGISIAFESPTAEQRWAYLLTLAARSGHVVAPESENVFLQAARSPHAADRGFWYARDVFARAQSAATHRLAAVDDLSRLSDAAFALITVADIESAVTQLGQADSTAAG